MQMMAATRKITAMGRMKEAKASTAAIPISSMAHSHGCLSCRAESCRDSVNSQIPSSSRNVNRGSLATKLLYRIPDGRKLNAARATSPHSRPPISRAIRQTTKPQPTSSARLKSSAV